MPRPRAVQGEVEKRLLEALAKGAPIRIACAYAGCSHEAYYSECERNPDFAERAIRARTERAVKSLDAIWKAGDQDWRAHGKYLELTFPEDFSRRLELSGPQGGPVKVSAEVEPGFVADVLRILRPASDEPADEGPEEPLHSPPSDH